MHETQSLTSCSLLSVPSSSLLKVLVQESSLVSPLGVAISLFFRGSGLWGLRLPPLLTGTCGTQLGS